MQPQRNWQGWVALVVSVIALVVALGDRGHSRGGMGMGMMGDRQGQMMRGHGGMGQDGMMMPQAPQAPQAPGMGYDRHGMMQGDIMMVRGHSPFGFFGPLFGLMKLAGFALLAWLLFRMFTHRRPHHGPWQHGYGPQGPDAPPPPPAPPAPPMTPAGHDPRVE